MPYQHENKTIDFFENLNLEYAKRYDLNQDLAIIWQFKNNLDNPLTKNP